MQDIKILFEDDAILVLNKPAGITVNKSDTTIHESTVQDWTERRLGIGKSSLSFLRKQESSENQDNTGSRIKSGMTGQVTDYTSDEYFRQSFAQRGGIVHRLDKETSGILIVAKSWQAFKNLQQQFKDRLVEKTYLALVHGVLSPQAGEISVPVDRLPWNRRQFGVVPGGRESTTFYKTLQTYSLQGKQPENFSLVDLTPKTGRTHQIRVHMKYLNHPIVSDFLYAGRKTARDDRKLLERVFLHAAKISFNHPVTRERIHFESPLPEELQSSINRLTKL
ncbi:MAG TPA: RluA family pseudouridine synthase [Patescibacteria group bacterium]|nr:RluA family pseudouridine synthase [Patescibacteria group bacterium]